MIDLSKITPAPWICGRVARDEEPDTCIIGAHGVFFARVVGSPGRPAEHDATFIALARNAFDGDPDALAWWEANRKHVEK